MKASYPIGEKPRDARDQEEASSWRVLLDRAQSVSSGRKVRLERFARILELYRSRTAHLPSIVKVTGTSGKGSVCAILESMFLRDGKRVCTFTSPHLVTERERIRLNGKVVSSELWEHAATNARPFFDEILAILGNDCQPSFFETVLLLALNISQANEVDILLLEVAVGGYNDVVSLFSSPLSAITTVGIDHQLELGDTVSEIAADKVGIASAGSTLVLGPSIQGEARSVILLDAAQREVKVVQADRSRITPLAYTNSGSQVQVGDVQFRLPLPGRFQLDNLATALSLLESAVLLGWANNLNSVSGASQTHWPARLELVRTHPLGPYWLIDAGHNPLAYREIRTYITEFYPTSKVALVFGASELDKASEGLTILSPAFDAIFVTTGFYRSAVNSINDLHNAKAILDKLTFVRNPLEAFRLALECKEPFDLIVVTGSVFLVGHWKTLFMAGSLSLGAKAL